ncbi:hypothetical protein BDV96DRAFT_651555 [Lophiotrema nucula]|uniref:ABM domain-containing protein n=1 Tax=Lophiotrema nucula TaxID=690887 RepID=A0A6A5YTD4_9PLEO|nr:hypothetical protein BDV96DRAFT_651555 [Lophiotrema nucula]
MSSPPTIYVNVTFFITPGTEEKFHAAFQPLYEEIKLDKHLQYFNVLTDIQKPGVIRMTEVWKAEVQFLIEASPKRKNYKPFFDAIKEIEVKEHTIDAFTAVEGFTFNKSG